MFKLICWCFVESTLSHYYQTMLTLIKRNIRPILNTLTTRSRVGETGKFSIISSITIPTMEAMTKTKSKTFQPAVKYWSRSPMIFTTHSKMITNVVIIYDTKINRSMKYLSIESTLSQIIYLNWKLLWTMHSIFPEWRWKLLIGCNAQCPSSPYSKRSKWKWQFQIWSQNERGNVLLSYESAKYHKNASTSFLT